MTELAQNSKDIRLPFAFSRKYGVLIKDLTPDYANIFFKGSPQINTLIEIRRFIDMPLRYERVGDDDFENILSELHQTGSMEAVQMVEDLEKNIDLNSLANAMTEDEDLLEHEDNAPIIRLINALLIEALKVNASDIHIEVFERSLIVRFRVDGVLQKIVEPKRTLAPLLISRIKVMAKLDIAEKRIPQDGHISLRVGGREVDIRVSTIPSSSGERIVMRLLDKKAGFLDIDHLGMTHENLLRMKQIINNPHGIILVTGPTGSGKTTTLYSTLLELNNGSRNIMTIEDPVEYMIEGIGQTQVNTKVGMSFSKGLRAILRQDPDIIMVGEIRDKETADIAVQSSLTGHLVLSTLHTNNAVGAVARLCDMGVETFLLSSSIVGLIAQRLVRALCPDCKEAYTANLRESSLLGLSQQDTKEVTIYKSTGCKECKGTGYKGRIGIYEVVEVDEEMKMLIHNNTSSHKLEESARRKGASIRSDAQHKILEGLTTIDELLRVTSEG